MRRAAIKYKRTAIKRRTMEKFERTRITYRTVVHYGRTFKVKDYSKTKMNRTIGIAMFEAFGRSLFRLSEKDMEIARERRAKYLRKFGDRVNIRNQTLSDADRLILYGRRA